MKVLQIGVPKAGNFWLYNILEQSMLQSGNPHRTFIKQHPIHPLAKTWDLNYPTQADIDMLEITDLQTAFRISSIFRMPLSNEPEYFSKTDHVWTHSPFCKASPSVFQEFSKKVYIIRDPRDMLLSASNYYCSPYMLKYFPQMEKNPEQFLEKNIDRLLHQWVWHVWDHLRLRNEFNIHISFFEGFRSSFQEELSLLTDYLQVNLSQTDKFAIEKAVHFDKLKKDNPKHLKRGRSGYWMDRLADQYLQKAEMIAGPMIRFLGYPGRGEKMQFSRNFPHENFEELKQQIIHSQDGRLADSPYAQLPSNRL